MSDEQPDKIPNQKPETEETEAQGEHHHLEEIMEPVVIEQQADANIGSGEAGNGLRVVPENERDWAAACHASALLGLIIPLANILMPLAIWLLKSEEMPFVQSNGKEAVNFQITLYLAVAVCALLTFIGIGWLLFLALGVYALVAVVKAAVAAKQGQIVHYKICIRFIS